MINFASLFNQFRMNNNSVGDLISAPGTTIDQLLDQESFLNQFKSGNTKVQQFMKYDKYETLVKYVAEVGPAQDRKRSYKYPFTACQLLCFDSNQTLEMFFSQNPIYVTVQVPVEPKQKKQVIDNLPVQQKNDQEKYLKENETPAQEQATQEQETKNQETQEQIAAGQKLQIVSNQQKKSQQPSQQQTPKTQFVEKQVRPLSQALFTYFKGEINYTLAGYVSKIFNAFLSKKPKQVFSFLIKPQRFSCLLDHIESRSVGQLVVKLLTTQLSQIVEERKQAFQLMIEKSSKSNEVYIASNLANSICEIIEKIAANVKSNTGNWVQLSRVFFTPEIITTIITNVMSDEQNISVYNSPILQTYLINVPFVVPENSQISNQLKTLIQSFLKKTLQKIKVNRENRPTLGFGRMKIIQIISYVLKQNILNSRQIAGSQPELFTILLDLCVSYQYNNVLHNQVVKIIEIAFNQPQNSNFLQLLLNNDQLLQFLIRQSQEDQKIRAGNGSQKARKGYIAHIVAICKKIQEASKTNPTVAKLNQKQQFAKIIESLVDKQTYQYNKALAGYSVKRNKHPIVYGKEEALQNYITFLTKSPPPVYDQEPEHINIEHPDLVEAQHMQKQLQEQEMIAEIQKEQKVLQEEEHFNPKYYNYHIEYNVDDLMVQL